MAAAGLLATVISPAGFATEFTYGDVNVSVTSTVTTGAGRRLNDPSCSIVGAPGWCGGAPNTAAWSAADDGNLNYRKGDFFTAYLKGTHEVLVTVPDGWKFMARGVWKKDFKADDTARTDLSSDTRQQIVNNAELLDFWVTKNFQWGGQNGRVRLGKQVISWGESLFTIGGISNNVLDFQKLAVPGTQLKEAFLPINALSVSSSLADGLSGEAYVQFRHRPARLAPVGSYFSFSDLYGNGRVPVSFSGANFNVTGLDQYTLTGKRSLSDAEAMAAITANGDFPVGIAPYKLPGNSPQYGASLHYKAPGSDVDFGFYVSNYHDQFPVFNLIDGASYQAEFLKNRHMFGVSTNFPLGNWAIGSELSYRPKDAMSLSGCFAAGSAELDANTAGVVLSRCPLYKDSKKYQWSTTALLQLQPNQDGQRQILNLLGADSAFMTAEATVTRYPGARGRIRRTIEGVDVEQVMDAAYFVPLRQGSGGYPIAANLGTVTSWGYVLDFNWTYDGKLIQGWQVTPGVTFAHSVKGDTPNYTGQFLEGNKSANFYILFNQNPTVWQAGINYSRYMGGKNDVVDRQYYKDRDFVGAFLSYNF
jgi:hypothetical protein